MPNKVLNKIDFFETDLGKQTLVDAQEYMSSLREIHWPELMVKMNQNPDLYFSDLTIIGGRTIWSYLALIGCIESGIGFKGLQTEDPLAPLADATLFAGSGNVDGDDSDSDSGKKALHYPVRSCD